MMRLNTLVTQVFVPDRVILLILIVFQYFLYAATGKVLDVVNDRYKPSYIRYECYNNIKNNINALINMGMSCIITFVTLILNYPWNSLLFRLIPTKEDCSEQFAFPVDYQQTLLNTFGTLTIWHLSFLYQSSFYCFDIVFECLEYRKFKMFYNNEANKNAYTKGPRLSRSQLYHFHTVKNDKTKYLQLLIVWRLLELFQIFAIYHFNLLNGVFMLYIIIGLSHFSNLIVLIGKLLFFASKSQNTAYIINAINASIIVGVFTKSLLLLLIPCRYIQCVWKYKRSIIWHENNSSNMFEQSKLILNDKFDAFSHNKQIFSNFIIVVIGFVQIAGFFVYYITQQWWIWNLYEIKQEFPISVINDTEYVQKLEQRANKDASAAKSSENKKID